MLFVRSTIVFACLLVAGNLAAEPFQVGFREIDLSGITATDLFEMADGFGGGLAISDYDDDGDLDIFLPNREGMPDRLLRNDDGVFQNVAAAAGVDGVPATVAVDDKPRSRGALWLDVDGDRRLDLLVIGDCWNCPVTVAGNEVTTVDPRAETWSRPRLYRQRGDHTFEDASASSGLDAVDFLQDCPTCLPHGNVFRHLGGLAAGDLNQDGLPDIFVGHWSGTALTLAAPHNGRILLSDVESGTYSYAPQLIGVPGTPASEDLLRGHWQSVIRDWNGDGRQDVLTAIDGASNHLWLNPGGAPLEPFFDDAVAADLHHTRLIDGSPESGTDMGASVGDYNNDGLFDLYLTNTNSSASNIDQLLQAKHDTVTDHGTPVYSDQIKEAGIQGHTEPVADIGGQSWGWGVTFFDADLDGWLDLAITNGFSDGIPGFSPGTGIWTTQATDRSLLFINNLPEAATEPSLPVFANASEAWGFNDTDWGSGLGALDLDRDGDLDLAQTTQQTYPPNPAQESTFRLLRNDLESSDPQGRPHWLVIRPRLTTANSHALGAVVRVKAELPKGDTVSQSRPIMAGTSFMTQEPAEAHFGFGTGNLERAEVRIEWPDGRPDSVFEIDRFDRVITYGWCNQMDLARPYGVLDSADISAWSGLAAAGDARVDFVHPFGVLDLADMQAAGQLFHGGCPTETVPANDLP